MGLQQFNELLVDIQTVTLTNADGTTPTLLCYTDNAQNRFDALLLCTDSAVDLVVEFWYGQGSPTALLGSIVVPAGSGKGGVHNVDAVPYVFANNLAGWVNYPTSQLYVALETALAVGKSLWATSAGGYC